MSYNKHIFKSKTPDLFLSRKILLFTSLLSFAFLNLQTVYALGIKLNWAPVSDPTVGGYNIYYGTQSRNYTSKADAGKEISYIIANLEAGKKYFFAATTYDNTGNESAFSNEIVCTIPANTSTTTTVSDGGGGGSGGGGGGGSSINSAPVANAGDDRTITVGTIISLDGERSYDPDGDVLQYEWQVISGPANYILQNSITATPSFKTSDAGLYVISLKVFDGVSYSAEDTVTITVKSKNPGTGGSGTDGGGTAGGNSAPVAEAGANQTGTAGDVITLDGSDSSDKENSPLTYSWQQISGTTVTLENADTQRASFAALAAGTYTFELMVSDGQLYSAPDTVTVTITDAGSGSGTIKLVNLEPGKLYTESPVLEWQADGYDLFKVQISKDGQTFYTVCITRAQSFTPRERLLNLITLDTPSPIYWKVLGRDTANNSWAASDIGMFSFVNDERSKRKEKIKEVIEEILQLFKVIVASAT